MWKNFKSMPLILKLLTAHAISCIVFLIASIIPHSSFVMYGQSVTYSEWWGSGVGVYASILGTLMASAGFLLVTKNHIRQMFLCATKVCEREKNVITVSVYTRIFRA